MSNELIQQETSPPDLPPTVEEVGDKTFGSDEAGLREAARWKREQQQAVADPGIQDQHSTPIVERHLSKDGEKHLETFSASSALRLAAKEISDQHKREEWQRHGFDASIEQIEGMEDWARANNKDQNFDVHHASKGHTIKLGLAREDGSPVRELSDHTPVGFSDLMNVNDATRALGEFRRQAEAEREALLKQYGEQASADEARVVDEARKAVEAASGPPPKPTDNQPQPAPDPTAQERERLQAQYNAVAAVRQMGDQEIEARRELTAIGRWAQQTYSPAELSGDPNALAELQRTNPEKFQNLHTAGAHWGHHQNTLRQIGQTRQAQNVQAQAARQQQVDAWGAQQDREAVEAVKRDLPQFTRDDAAFDRLRAATRKAMLSAGWSKDQLDSMWRAGQLRSVATQRALAKLGAFQMMQDARANLDSHKAKPLPPVRPGVHRESSVDSDADIAALERAVGRERNGSDAQIRAAARLTAALRRSGRIQVG
jgi:hypothetical protein